MLWHESTEAETHRPTAKAFLDEYKSCLDTPSPIAFTVGLISNYKSPTWTADEWAEMAATRRAARTKGREAPLPPAVDALLQLETAEQLEAVGRHEEAVTFAANAVEECPGHEQILAWERRRLARDYDPNFNIHEFLFGTSGRAGEAKHEIEDRPDETGDGEQSQSG